MKILTKVLWIILCFSGSLMASVQLEIENGVVVETTGGVYVEIDGELNENGNGYFKGKISSGNRTVVTSFAGMTLSVGIDGSITRTTGSAYAKGNGEGTNFLRYYEVNNSGIMVTVDMHIAFVSSGSYDERNSLAGPYYIYRYSTNWNGYGEGAYDSPLSASDIHILSGLTDWVISDNDFILFTDSEVAIIGTPLLFNESAEGGDGHDVEMTFSNLSGNGNLTVEQTNRAPSNLLTNKSLTYFWDISKDAGITAFTTDVSFKYLDSDLLDVTEEMLVVAYYDITQSEWSIFQDYTLDQANNTLTVHNLDHFTRFAVGESEAFMIPVTVDVRVFLEGPFDADTMSTALLNSGSIPLSQPYGGSPWNYSGIESVTSIPAGVVDWILLQLRSSVDSSSTVATRAAFLKSDGSIVDLGGGSQRIVAGSMRKKVELMEAALFLTDRDGRKYFERPNSRNDAGGKFDNIIDSNPKYEVNSTSPVKFYVAEGDYYIVIHHRNHLSVMSAIAHTISSTSASYDFTTGVDKYYGSAAKLLDTGIYGMYAGDANGNGQIQNDDKNVYWASQVGGAGYLGADFNLNGQVQNDDKNVYWNANVGAGTQVP